MIRANPGNQKTIGAAQALLGEGKPGRAAMLCKQRLAAPGAGKDPGLFAVYATALTAMGNLAEARKVLKKSIRDFPKSPEMLCRMGITYFYEYRFGEAKEFFKKAIALDPSDPWASRCLADTLIATGDHTEALAVLEPQIKPGQPAPADIAMPLCQVYLKLNRFQDALDLADRTLKQGGVVPMIETNLRFSRADALRGLNEYSDSFAAYQEANGGVATAFDRDGHRAEVDRSIGAWTPEAIGSLPASKRKSSHLVFIVGMFRSGTSLCEQIIASHPRAFGAGELTHMMDIVARFKGNRRGASGAVWDLSPFSAQNIDNAAAHYHQQVTPLAPGSDVITDKMPSNLLALGLIGQLFPDCKVVYCKRDPRDSLLSCYFNRFNADRIDFSYDLEDLGSCFADYWRIMEHWKSVLRIPILEVQYEQLVADPEAESRRLVEFTGLEWNDRCLDFHKTRRTTKTLSADQVNKPIYTDSIARWKPYEEHFAPMMKWLPAESLWAGSVDSASGAEGERA